MILILSNIDFYRFFNVILYPDISDRFHVRLTEECFAEIVVIGLFLKLTNQIYGPFHFWYFSLVSPQNHSYKCTHFILIHVGN